MEEEETAEKIWNLLVRDKAHFYLCGDASRLSHDVYQTLIKIGIKKGMTEEQSHKFLEQDLKERYFTDVWS